MSAKSEAFKKKLEQEITFYNHVLSTNDYKAMGKAFNTLHPRPHGKYCAVAKKREDAIASYNAGYSTKSKWPVVSCADGSCGTNSIMDNAILHASGSGLDSVMNACGCSMGVDGMYSTPNYDGDLQPNPFEANRTIDCWGEQHCKTPKPQKNIKYDATVAPTMDRALGPQGYVATVEQSPFMGADGALQYVSPGYMNTDGPTKTSALKGTALTCAQGKPLYPPATFLFEKKSNKDWNRTVCQLRRDENQADKDVRQDLRGQKKTAKIGGINADTAATNATALLATNLANDPGNTTATGSQGTPGGSKPPVDGAKDNTWLYVGIGAGILGLATVGFFVWRSMHK